MRGLGLCMALAMALLPAMGNAADLIRVQADGCAACHTATSGNPLAPLAGKPIEELKAALSAFRAGTRPATVMDRIARGYSERQLDAIAAEWAAQPSKAP